MTPADLRELAAILNEAADRAENPEPGPSQPEPSPLFAVLKPMLELHEGRRLRIYVDTVGKQTIGVGRNIDDRGLSDDEVDHLLANDMAIGADDARRWLGDAAWSKLGLARQAALADFSMNLGLTTLMEFRATRAKLLARDYAGAANNMLASRWANQVGKEPGQRAWRITEMVRTGKLPTDVPGLDAPT